jgi:hypothetical protein
VNAIAAAVAEVLIRYMMVVIVTIVAVAAQNEQRY